MYMATQIQTRKQRGEQFAPEDITELNHSSFFVKSQTGKSGYSVTRIGKTWACDCFDFKFRGHPCKHVYAILNFLDEQCLNSRYKLGLWEELI
jgi:hypothetical protein